MFFNIKVLKKKLLKNEVIFVHFFPYQTHIFLARNYFAVEIKECTYTRSKNSVRSKILLSRKRPYNVLMLRKLHYEFWFIYSRSVRFFNKTSKKEDIPLNLPRLQTKNFNLGRIPSINFQRAEPLTDILYFDLLNWNVGFI